MVVHLEHGDGGACHFEAGDVGANQVPHHYKPVPGGNLVYFAIDNVQFDPRGAAHTVKPIKFCWRQKWHVICAIKSNRRINEVRIDQHNLALKHQPYEQIMLEAVDLTQHKAPKYYTRLIKGHLDDFAEPVHAIISKKRPGDKFPKYFVCTDLTLSVQQALRYYQKRWPVEVDNTFLKNALGFGDFRLQSFEITEKWFAVVKRAINYLQYCMALAYSKNLSKTSLADFTRQYRLEHFQNLLRSFQQPFAQP